MDYQWLCLFHVKGLGPKKLHAIYNAVEDGCVTLDEIFTLEQKELNNRLPVLTPAICQAIHEIDCVKIEELHGILKENDINIVTLTHELYPDLLFRRLHEGTPAVLFCKGNLDLLSSDGVAIIGARCASSLGLELASQIAAQFSAKGMNIVSGFAKGIDTEAHRGSVESGGTTTIVWSSGIINLMSINGVDDINWNSQVLALSQFHPYSGWSPANAMIRSKLICAMSRAVIVIESGTERGTDGKLSGTFATGKTALALNVPLLVISPDVFDRRSEGNYSLIRLGGVEVTVDNVLENTINQISESTQNSVIQETSAEQLSFV